MKIYHIEPWLGKQRQDCLEQCRKYNLDNIQFAHWLAIPSLQIMLTFYHQMCVEVVII